MIKGVIPPGKTIGIIGGGQLGRMMALAARPLGYKVHVLDPDPDCAAAPVVEKVITASFDDVDAARTLAKGVDVVTLEIEKVGIAALTAAAEHTHCRPDAQVLETIQDRAVQKRWLKGHAIPIGPYMEAASPAQLKRAAEQLGGRCFVKAAHGGYDGRGQMELASADEAATAWDELKADSVVVEFALELDKELSVLVARGASGEVAVYPVAHNHHENRILAWSVIPAAISEELATKAQDLARGIADGLKIVGLLAVEMFVTKTGELLVNELAPRPHNSYHASDFACVTSQFEQAIRAVCGLPLGAVTALRPCAISNILGDAWAKGEPNFARALSIPNLKLSLYGKTPKPGRKMGHFTATAETGEDAVAVVKRALNQLRG